MSKALKSIAAITTIVLAFFSVVGVASAAVKYPKTMDKCSSGSPWVIGYNSTSGKGVLVYLSCGPDSHLHTENSAPKINQKTGIPVGGIPQQALSNQQVLQGHTSQTSSKSGASSAQPSQSSTFDRNNGDSYPNYTLNAPADGITYTSPCQNDPQVPAEWASVQTWADTNMNCARPYRYVAGSTDFGTPKSVLTSDSSNLPIQQCKLQNNPSSTLIQYTGFPRPASAFNPVKSAVIQVVPVEFSDFKAANTPASDYQNYVNFLTNFLINSSDVPINPVVRMPNHYFQLSGTLASYHLDEHSNTAPFQSEMVNVTKNEINYSGVDEILIVVPPQVPSSQLFASGLGWGPTQTPAGAISSTYVMGGHAFDARNNSGEGSSTDPWITVHEAIGHMMGLNDQYGDDTLPYSQSMPANPQDIGTGNWGNMSGVYGDLLVWQKWLVGFEADSQIDCVSANTNGTYWIRPNTTKGNFTKGVMIPLSSTSAVFVESQRSTGYNFKMPKAFNGALVYSIDTTAQKNGYGMYVARPGNRIGRIDPEAFKLGNATLVQGESISVQGVKVSVVESGDFGDVVKISSSS